ncbi:MAG: ATP-binding cassette domain-containing protein, partial [Coriobacteriia bacterium]|nr:ATP-binding cassette domain-containing protein [Coriobacteriia bacterium]
MAIVFDEVSYTYHQSAPYPALNKFSVSIELGSFVGLIGHTGSGKSTLLEHINGLKLPQSGRVLINGLDTSDKKQRRKIRSLVGFITQNPEHQLFAETVFEDIAFGPRNIGVDEENIKTRVHEALKKTGIEPSEELLAKSPFELSGGEQRRVAIAGILAMKPQILAMDEPFAGLDPAGRRRIMKLTKELNDEGT